MPRAARELLPAGFVHVTARGNRRQQIFVTDGDAHEFLRLLRSVHGLWNLCAYCLMPNHFHVVVDTTHENLSRAMEFVNGRYAQWFNRKHKLDGRLFQGRYKAKPIQGERYLDDAIRYVVMNPVRAGLCSDPAAWPWSNYRELRDRGVL